MTLYYEPELIDYRLQSYTRDNKHYVRGHLLGTKTGSNGWSVSKETFTEQIKQFKGFPFIVSPKQLDPSSHFLVGASYDDQLEKQKVVTKGNITDIFGPFSYNDGTDDVYCDFEAEITDKPVSDALITGRLPFMTSPYVWPTDEKGIPLPIDQIKRQTDLKYWKPVHDALVEDPAFGFNSKIHKQCIGPKGQCNQALAGSSEDVAKILSSQILTQNQKPITMENNETIKKVDIPESKPIEIQFSQAPVKTTEVEEKKTEVNPEIEALQKESAEKDKTIQKLLLRQKTQDLESIFTGNFENEDAKKATFKKYIDFDTDILREFHADVLKYGIPKKILKENALAGSSDNQKETFPLAGSNNNMQNQEYEEQSLTKLLGGPIA